MDLADIKRYLNLNLYDVAKKKKSNYLKAANKYGSTSDDPLTASGRSCGRAAVFSPQSYLLISNRKELILTVREIIQNP